MSLQSWLGLNSTPASIIIELDDAAKRAKGGKDGLPVYYDGETISGLVHIDLKPGKVLEHHGIKIEFVGAVDILPDRSQSLEFINLVRELAPPGQLIQSQPYPFEYRNVEKQQESYSGRNARLRYFLRATITKRLGDQTKEMEIWVHTLHDRPDINSSIKMEVGVEDALHIEFEYQRSKYHLQDVIVGKIFFQLVRIKIKYMELCIIRKESIRMGSKPQFSNEVVKKFEIMDGAPVKGECIPIRLFLAAMDLTPTMRDICKRFSVRYFLNLVLVDEEDRRYFKQQEFTLWRTKEAPAL